MKFIVRLQLLLKSRVGFARQSVHDPGTNLQRLIHRRKNATRFLVRDVDSTRLVRHLPLDCFDPVRMSRPGSLFDRFLENLDHIVHADVCVTWISPRGVIGILLTLKALSTSHHRMRAFQAYVLAKDRAYACQCKLEACSAARLACLRDHLVATVREVVTNEMIGCRHIL